MELMLFDSKRKAKGYFHGSLDMEIGDSSTTNDFVSTDTSLSDGMYLVELNEEWGGIVEKMGDYVSEHEWSGHTWRGLLQQCIIEPPEGEDYLVMSGDINEIIGTVTANMLGGFFTPSTIKCGVSAEKYRFKRYCTGLDGLMDLCAEYGCKLVIRNVIRDERLSIELSAERRLTYGQDAGVSTVSFTVSRMGINHLICAASGELADRTIVHLYLWPDGSIKQSPYYTGFEERTALYSYTSEQDLTELIKEGKEKLLELASYRKMEISVSNEAIDIGDIAYATRNGVTVSQSVIRKILSFNNGNYNIEYKIKGAE